MTKILIIDDDAGVRRIVRRILQRAGKEVIEAADGVTGIQMVRGEMPDLVICDVVMTDLDGFDVLRKLQEDSDTALVPFIFLTGQTGIDSLRHGMDMGADDYLFKPFTPDDLLEAVESRLKKHRLQEQKSEKKLDQLRQRITYLLPHELRTPLSSIMGLSELLESDAESMDPPRLRKIAGGLAQSAERLSRRIENYILYARLEAGDDVAWHSDDQEHAASAKELVQHICEAAAQAADRTGDLRFEGAEEITLSIPEEHFSKICSELVDNAYKFSSPGDPVEVRLSSGGDELELLVKDSGRGMSQDEINSIGAFQQFDRDEHEQGGMGLGLVIARKIAVMHGGSVEVRSRKNSGTAVTVRLPLK